MVQLHMAQWAEGFLRSRGLVGPDGRALYAYRCSESEFKSLSDILRDCDPNARPREVAVRGFVLYAAEWWQREYDGRVWAWEPLLESIRWHGIHYPDLYRPIKRAWTWWKIEPVRLPSSIRYLGTIACQGGLPLGLVGDAGSSITRYLRAVLKDVDAFRQIVEDPIVLAQDQQHLLRPPTLRRDYVFRLAADLTERVLDLRESGATDMSLESLDEVEPAWRRSMPLALDDRRAQDLLTGLLRDAIRTQTEPRDEFRVERFLRRTGLDWRLGAAIRLPPAISGDVLARQLQVGEADLGPRLQVRVNGNGTVPLGLYAARGEDFVLLRDSRSAVEIWDSEAAGEVRIEFLAGGVVGRAITPMRGSALNELPWAFRKGDDYSFIGEGSVSSRSPEILVLVAEDWRPSSGQPFTDEGREAGEGGSELMTRAVRILGRTLWRLSERAEIETLGGRCVIRPGSSQAGTEEYWLAGERCHDCEARWPLFRGVPRLQAAKPEERGRAVPRSEVGWRPGRGDWVSAPTGFGLWEVRHTRDGELRHYGRVGILPDRFQLSIEPGSDMSHGRVALEHGESVRVAGYGPDAEVQAEMSGRRVSVRVESPDADNPPARVRLRLQWAGVQDLIVQLPFPGQGGRLLRDGKPVANALSVGDLYGIRAVALSPEKNQEFWLEGELKATDMGGLQRLAHLREPLRKSGLLHELPLIELRTMIELLLSASGSSGAYVSLRIVDRAQRIHQTARVTRFSGKVDFNPSLGRGLVSVSAMSNDEVASTLEAHPLQRPGDSPIEIDGGPVAGTAHVATLPASVDLSKPWLLVARDDDKVLARPKRVGGTIPRGVAGLKGGSGGSLADALAIEDEGLRIEGIGAALDAMLAGESGAASDGDWAFLTDSLLRAEDLPATSLDLVRVLATKPRLLVRCLFVLEGAPRRFLWNLEEELPFSWLLVRRDHWWREANRAHVQQSEHIKDLVEEHDRIAREHVESVLVEGSGRWPALTTVLMDFRARKDTGGLASSAVLNAQQKRDEMTGEQIRVRASLDDWPVGYGRAEWAEELGAIPESLWQNGYETRRRQPVFDTPVAAAYCCFVHRPTERTTFLVKRMRAHDPDWFDVAYRASWLLLAEKQDAVIAQRQRGEGSSR